MTAEQAIHSFWSNFGLTAYDENSVPDDANLPYITYTMSYDTFGTNVAMSASIWQKSTSWLFTTQKAKAISEYIGDGGVLLSTDNGSVWVKRGTPFYNRIGQEEKDIKQIRINIYAEYFQQN